MDTIYTGQTKEISLVLKDDSGVAIDLSTATQVIGYVKHNKCIIAKFCVDDIQGFQTFTGFPIGYGHMYRDHDVVGKVVLQFTREITTTKQFQIEDVVDIEFGVWLLDGSEIVSNIYGFLNVSTSDVLLKENKKV